MGVVRKDYIERLIEQVAQALAAILRVRREKRYAEAQALVRDSCLALLGMEFGMLTAVDARSAAELLGHPERVRALARLVEEEAEARLGQGDAEGASAWREHARALLEEAERLQAR